jgi:hypothetical protein
MLRVPQLDLGGKEGQRKAVQTGSKRTLAMLGKGGIRESGPSPW